MSQNAHCHRTVSNSSSGYVSSDSVPSSPLTPSYRPNKSTQTPSLSSQVITHAMHSLSQTQHRGPSHGPCPLLPLCSARPTASSEGDMPPEEIALELRRIGDEFDHLYFRAAHAGGNGQAVLGRLRQQIPDGPGLMLFLGLLIGRLFQYIMRRR
ncbi:bcl-2-like protein 11 isoform X2 [Sardina pilchardus]